MYFGLRTINSGDSYYVSMLDVMFFFFKHPLVNEIMGLGCNMSDSCKKRITSLYLDIFTTSLHLLICMLSRSCLVCPSRIFYVA
jgi:hypothetical protein